RAVLLVEWAEAPEVLVALGQTDVLLDDLDQVDLGLDLGEGVVGRRGGHMTIVSGHGFASHRVVEGGRRRRVCRRDHPTPPTDRLGDRHWVDSAWLSPGIQARDPLRLRHLWPARDRTR